MATANVTDPRYARIWVNATAPATPPAADPGPPIVPKASLLCAINAKAFNQSLATGTAVLPDCATPTKVSIIKRTAISKDWNITGNGYLEPQLLDVLRLIMESAISVGVVFEINDPTTAPTPATDGYWAGKAFLETFNVIANNADSYITVDLTFTADGPATWNPTTSAPPAPT